MAKLSPVMVDEVVTDLVSASGKVTIHPGIIGLLTDLVIYMITH